MWQGLTIVEEKMEHPLILPRIVGRRDLVP